MVDSSEAAIIGALAGGLVAWRLSDGDWRHTLIGAGIGLVAVGEGTDRALAA